jgi:hypothetical protein
MYNEFGSPINILHRRFFCHRLHHLLIASSHHPRRKRDALPGPATVVAEGRLVDSVVAEGSRSEAQHGDGHVNGEGGMAESSVQPLLDCSQAVRCRSLDNNRKQLAVF